MAAVITAAVAGGGADIDEATVADRRWAMDKTVMPAPSEGRH